MVKNFLMEDEKEEDLDRIGVIYDETGFDGLEGPRFRPAPVGSDDRFD